MPKNAKEVVHGKQMKILMVGPPGAGKTTLARSLPGRKFALIFDPNSLESLAGSDIDYEAFLPDAVPITAMPISTKNQPTIIEKWKPQAYLNFERWYKENMTEEFIQSYDWIIVDSYTSLANLALDEIMALNNRPSRRPLIDDYGSLVQTMENIFRDLIPKVNNIYVTAHSYLDKDDLTGTIMFLLQMTKGQVKNIPLLFTDIWAAQSSDKGEPEVQFVQDRRHPWIRSSLGKSVQPIENVFIANMSDPVSRNEGLTKILRKAGRIK